MLKKADTLLSEAQSDTDKLKPAIDSLLKLSKQLKGPRLNRKTKEKEPHDKEMLLQVYLKLLDAIQQLY